MILCGCLNPSIDTFLHVDAVTSGTTNRVRLEESFAGGKGVHVALACRELGEEVVLLGIWGGQRGAWMRRFCEARGVTCAGPVIKKESRMCLTLRTADGFNETEFLGLGPEINAEAAEELNATFGELLPLVHTITLSGSLPPGLPTETYASLAERARAADRPVLLDVTGKPAQAALRSPLFGLHLNANESRALLGSETADLHELGLELRSRFPRTDWIALTGGREGLYLVTREACIHAWRHIEAVHSTVGSGDCLTAGLAVAHARGLDAREAARLGVACGAANCLRAELGMLHAEEVAAQLPRVELREFPL